MIRNEWYHDLLERLGESAESAETDDELEVIYNIMLTLNNMLEEDI